MKLNYYFINCSNRFPRQTYKSYNIIPTKRNGKRGSSEGRALKVMFVKVYYSDWMDDDDDTVENTRISAIKVRFISLLKLTLDGIIIYLDSLWITSWKKKRKSQYIKFVSVLPRYIETFTSKTKLQTHNKITNKLKSTYSMNCRTWKI